MSKPFGGICTLLMIWSGWFKSTNQTKEGFRFLGKTDSSQSVSIWNGLMFKTEKRGREVGSKFTNKEISQQYGDFTGRIG